MSAATQAGRARPDLTRSRTADGSVQRPGAERMVKPCSVSRLVFDGVTVCPGHRAASYGFSGGVLPVTMVERRTEQQRVHTAASPPIKSTAASPGEHAHSYDPPSCRLREYSWKTEQEIRRETPEAADRFYKHTYGTAHCSSVDVRFPERSVGGQRLRARLRCLQRATAATRPRADSINMTSGRLLERLDELEQMRHPSLVIDVLQPSQQEGETTDDQCDDYLYSQVAQSIGLFSANLDRSRATHSRLRGRPTTEYASTPRILSAASLGTRSSKSADAYIGYLERQSRPATDSWVMSTPGGPSQHMYNPTAAETRLLQIVADCNNPEAPSDSTPGVRQDTVAPPGANRPHPAASDKTATPGPSSNKGAASEYIDSVNKSPGNGTRKSAIVAPPPRRQKANMERVACRPLVRKELTIIVPMV